MADHLPPLISIAAEPLDSPDATMLIGELNAHLSSIYEAEDTFFSLPVADVFLVARRADGEPLGCGAVRRLDPSTGEIKRMWVRPEAQGRGIAGTIVAELERWAVDNRVDRLVLETGQRQHAAIRLYERAGFTPIPRFGPYVDAPLSLCYEKRLAPRP